MRSKLVWLLFFVTALIFAGCSSGGSAGTVTLVSIAVTPANQSIAIGTTTQLTATGTYSDNTTRDITSTVVWSSSADSIVTVNTAGKATAVAVGSSTISAAISGKSGSTGLSVINAVLQSIAVTPINLSIGTGTTQQYAATGLFSESGVMSTQDLTSQVSWSSSDTSKATISSTGLASAVASGVTTISASINLGSLLTGTTSLTITPVTLTAIAVTPVNPSIAVGTTRQFTATGTFSDGSTQDLTSQVSWLSSDLTKATIAASGLASSLAAGTTTISATMSGVTGSTVLTVAAVTLSSIAVTPVNPSISIATTKQFTATGTYSNAATQDLTDQVTWSSSVTSVAVVSNASGTKGLSAGVAAGTSSISATLGAISGSTDLTVTSATLVSIAITPTSQSISVNPAGTNQQYTAIGTYSSGPAQDLTSQVVWTSDNVAVASISNAAGSNGKAFTVSAGTAHITAALGAITSNQATLTVTSSALVSIAVTPANQNLPRGQTIQLTATGTYADASTQNLTSLVNWTSSATSIATVSNSAGSKGLVSGLNVIGTAEITATSGVISGNSDVEVE